MSISALAERFSAAKHKMAKLTGRAKNVAWREANGLALLYRALIDAERNVVAGDWQYSEPIDAVNRGVVVTDWYRDNLKGPTFGTRVELHDYVRSLVTEPVDYLEFGVWKGESLRHWCGLLKGERSRLFGFDTFTGLPEPWDAGQRILHKGHFALPEPPTFDDGRVELWKGLFQRTLAPARISESGFARIVHIDCDLYSGALYVLTQLAIKRGDYLIFDEFSDALGEFQAYQDWTRSYMRKCTVVGSSENGRQVAFEVIE